MCYVLVVMDREFIVVGVWAQNLDSMVLKHFVKPLCLILAGLNSLALSHFSRRLVGRDLGMM